MDGRNGRWGARKPGGCQVHVSLDLYCLGQQRSFPFGDSEGDALVAELRGVT
jgi:hypothetical protein